MTDQRDETIKKVKRKEKTGGRKIGKKQQRKEGRKEQRK